MDMQKLRVLFGPKVKKVFKIIGIAIVVF
ncbi:MAG: hypothetical protein UV02_C0067G0001, partial [Candidatus Kuenenbacteria bacterium GW2011_GWA2_42_15]